MLSAFRQCSLLYKTTLKQLKRLFIPFGVVSTAALLTTFHKVKAETLNSNSSNYEILRDFIFKKDGSITQIFKDDGESNLKALSDFIEVWILIGKGILKIINWLNHLPENITSLSATLLIKIYEWSMLVLQTPLFIFNNSYLKDTSLTFMIISVLIVTILTMIEMIKKMLMKNHTNFQKILIRWGIAVSVAGFTPFFFEQAFSLLNKLTVAITKIGTLEIMQGKENINDVLNGTIFSGFDTFLLIIFDLVIIALMIPIFLQNGRRFFDLMCLSAITPLALVAWIFDDYKHLFNRWWNRVKLLSQTQLVYAIFITIMGIFIFGTSGTLTGAGMAIKMLIIIGGLFRLINIPTFVKNKVDNGENILDMGKDIYKSGKKVWDTVTLNPARMFFKGMQENRTKNILALRKKYGQRYVKGLK